MKKSIQIAPSVTTSGAKNEKTSIKITTFNEQPFHARCFMYIVSYNYFHDTYLMV